MKALQLNRDWIIGKSRKTVYLQKGTNKYSLETLSDGFKSAITIIVNIMSSLQKGTQEFNNISGIVLIDEIELHLHPKWKLKFIKNFRSAFPKIQVFATTHDPLCLKGLFDGEVVLLKESKSGRIQCITDLPSVQGLKAEQLLTSEFFGLSSTIDPDDELVFNRYYKLLSKSNRTKAESNELKGLKQLVMPKMQIGDTLREYLSLEAADEVIAKEFINSNTINRKNLKTSTIRILKELLKKRNIK